MNKLAGIGKSGRAKLSKVLESTPSVITSSTLVDILNLSTKEASRTLSRWCKHGWLFRVKRGVYVPVPIDSTSSDIILEEPFVIIDSLYNPGYIGGFSAIKYWDLSEQIIETVYYFTTKQLKDHNPTYSSTNFHLKTVTPSRIFGTKTIWYGSHKIMISDPTKTIVDILNDPKLVGGMSVVYDIFNEYINSEHCNFKLLLDYSDRMKNKTILKRLGFMIDVKLDETPKELDNLKNLISSGYSSFDPSVGGNLIVEKWKLKVSTSWKLDYDSKK